MTRFQQIIIFLGLWWTVTAYAGDPSSFYVERNVVERIFNDSIAPSDQVQPAALFTPSIGLHMPGILLVSNRYFETDYAKDVSVVPFFQGRVSKSFWHINPHLLLGGGMAAGYGYSQSTVRSSDPSGQSFQDSFDIQWTNVEANTELAFTGYSTLKPSIQLGFGNAWIHQVGSLDGVDQTVAIPYLTIGTALEVQFSQQLTAQATANYELGIGGQKYSSWTLTLGTMVSI